jgi:hypothetical protein
MAGNVDIVLCGISDGNRDGNDGNHQRPDATVDSHVLPAHLA